MEKIKYSAVVGFLFLVEPKQICYRLLKVYTFTCSSIWVAGLDRGSITVEDDSRMRKIGSK